MLFKFLSKFRVKYQESRIGFENFAHLQSIENKCKHFLSLEERNKVKSHIRKMCLNEDEEETTDPQKVLDELKNLYSGLYKKRSTKTEQAYMQYLADINTPNLSEENKKTV